MDEESDFDSEIDEESDLDDEMEPAWEPLAAPDLPPGWERRSDATSDAQGRFSISGLGVAEAEDRQRLLEVAGRQSPKVENWQDLGHLW